LAPCGPCQPRFALKEQHLQRLVDLRGIAPSTFTYDNWALTDFLSRVLEPDDDPSSITRYKIDEFFRQRRPQLARQTFRHTVQVVRRYLRYAYDNGILTQPLQSLSFPERFASSNHRARWLRPMYKGFWHRSIGRPMSASATTPSFI